MKDRPGPPVVIGELEEELGRLPGVGTVTARRLAYHLLGVPAREALGLAQAITRARDQVVRCSRCGNLCSADPCWVCRDESRDRRLICVVEDPRDLLALEKAGVHTGLYHVLPARFAPLKGQGPEALQAERLLARVDEEGVEEVVLATNPDQEGEATAELLAGLLAGRTCRVSRIARGIPAGAAIEQSPATILADAFTGRRQVPAPD